MKKILGLTIAFIAILGLVGCEDTVTLTAPVVDYTVADNGATLSLTWDAIGGADGYIIYADGEVIDTVTTTSFDATVPAMAYAVTAYAGADNESDPDEVNCAAVKTASNLTVYGLSDPETGHNSGLGFTASGTAVTYSVVAANYADLDYIFDDLNYTNLTLTSPNGYDPVFNDEKNMGVDTDVMDFDAVTIANAPGAYSTVTAFEANTVYALFMDQDDDGWDTTDDHFGKIFAVSVTGPSPYTAVITVAYQPIAGLRWLVTD